MVTTNILKGQQFGSPFFVLRLYLLINILFLYKYIFFYRKSKVFTKSGLVWGNMAKRQYSRFYSCAYITKWWQRHDNSLVEFRTTSEGLILNYMIFCTLCFFLELTVMLVYVLGSRQTSC
jgi:hypothetical protein